MSQLLPSNSSLLDQRFSDFIDRRTKEDYSSLTVDPLKCHVTVLPHIAFDYGVSIKGMSEKESREFLDLIKRTRSITGTVGAIDKAINFFLTEGELKEWYQNRERFARGQFGIKTTNPNVFPFIENIKHFKNTRSKLVSIDDGNVSPRLKLSRDKYSCAIISDNDGDLLHGIKVSFKQIDFFTSKSINYEATSIELFVEPVNVDYFSIRYSSLVLGHKDNLTCSVTDGIYEYEPLSTMPKSWLGAWAGKWDGRYAISAKSYSIDIDTSVHLELGVSDTEEEYITSTCFPKASTHDTELDSVTLNRAWFGAWAGEWDGRYRLVSTSFENENEKGEN